MQCLKEKKHLPTISATKWTTLHIKGA